MTIFLASLVDATVILAIGLLLATALKRRSAAVRHAVLTTAIACAALMPVLELMVPQLPVVRWVDSTMTDSSALRFSSETQIGVASMATSSTGDVPRVTWPMVLVGLWAGATVLTLTAFAISLWRLRRLRASCAPVAGKWRTLTDSLTRECGIRRHVVLLQSSDPTLLVTFGMFRPGIILPAGADDWTAERQHVVLRHELAHIRRRDAAIQVAGELLRVMQPFNPLVWMTCRRLRQESEYACDDAVLSAGIEPTSYATHLLDVARRLSARQATWAAAPAIAHPSTLERRIVAMLQHHKNRQPLTKGGWTLAAIVALVVSLPVAAIGFASQAVTLPNSPVDVTATPVAPPTTVTNHIAPEVTAPVAPAPVRKTPLLAQLSLSGRVQDQTGGVIPGATVTLTNSQTQEVPLVAITNAPGAFQFPSLPPASYVLTAELVGFKKRMVAIDLSSGNSSNLTVTLEVGSLTEAIHVQCQTSSASLLQFLFPTLSAQAPPQAPIRVGGQIKPPRKTKDAKPVCPAGGMTGEVTVILEGQIGVNGFVTGLKAVRGDGSLLESAMTAVEQWEFTPTLLNGVPVEVTMTVTVTFKGA